MIRPLPPLPALRALEALDRLGSATAAAEEMHLTQSAVSRQLKTLEEQLGAEVFLRDRRALRLTPQAAGFARVVREALDRIAEGALALRLDPTGGALRLAILPSFGMHWLVPRLPRFARAHPEVTINMATRLKPFNFASEPFDAAIHFGTRRWPATDSLPLMEEAVQPLASPELVPHPLPPVALAELPLLHIQSRPRAWERWFEVQGLQPGRFDGTSFDQFPTIAQAATHGLGVALLPDFLSETERAEGRLVVASDRAPVCLGRYDLVWPVDRPVPPALALFRDWLSQEAVNA
ncbi:LysR substrate-binding domain-containing protein [Sagittula salina]|uniref:LysR family transcriptional regulator n=1 Tax=Sagittula salina TaxID=2820268 RepID=A0A940MMJ4_9RHOB|nr:LysR substrate-binding domain-containing protein [Sagittula salina]MBP0482079.1 LysR family transcriptional regulator [Sagittula salina]